MSILPAISNLSFPHLGFLFLLILSILLFYKFVIRMGIFSKLIYQKLTLQPSSYLYLQYQGPYGSLNTVCDKLISDTSYNPKQTNKPQLKPTGLMAISYDPPSIGPEFRAVVGILLSPSLKEDIEMFLKTHSDYSVKQIEQTTFLKTQIPMINRLSFLLLPFKVVPGLRGYIKENKVELNGFEGIVELYGMPEQNIIVGVPLEKQEQFNLTIYGKNKTKKEE